jgi:hypothetical protein
MSKWKNNLRILSLIFIAFYPIAFLLIKASGYSRVSSVILKAFILDFCTIGLFFLAFCIIKFFLLSLFGMLDEKYIPQIRKKAMEYEQNDPILKTKSLLKLPSGFSLVLLILGIGAVTFVLVILNDIPLKLLANRYPILNHDITLYSRTGSEDYSSLHKFLAIILSFIELKYIFGRPLKYLARKLGILQSISEV